VNAYNIGIESPSVDDCNICAELNIKIKELKKTDPLSSQLPFLEREASHEETISCSRHDEKLYWQYRLQSRSNCCGLNKCYLPLN
jgi:hypothetical protein